MKKKKSVLLLLTAILVAASAVLFTSCKKTGSAATYTVSFNSDGGSEVASMVINGGSMIDPPAAPVKISLQRQYDFIGWYNGDKKWDFKSDKINENLTLVARWELIGDYTVGFSPE